MRSVLTENTRAEKNERLKGFISVLLYCITGFACCTAYVFIFEKPDILPDCSRSFRLLRSVQYFITFMPVFITTSLLIGYAVIFGKSGQNTVPRYSSALLKYLKDVFVLLFFFIIAYFLLREVALPLVIRNQQKCMLKTQSYYDFIHAADISLDNSEYDDAYRYAKSAALLWPESPSAVRLLDNAHLHGAESIQDTNTLQLTYKADNAAIPFSQKLTAKKALSIAKKSMQQHDFYTAHFYAVQCCNLAQAESPYKLEGERLAALTWKHIEKGFGLLEAQFAIQLYREKKEAYSLINQKRYAEAYYRLLAIQKMIITHTPDKKDTDIERLITIAQKNLLAEVFFTDETLLFPVFAFAENIEFTTVEKNRDIKTRIKIQQLARIPNGKKQELYGKNTQITHYDSNGMVFSRYLVAFTKFVPALDAKDTPIIKLQINSIGKTHDKVALHPVPMKGSIPYTEDEGLALPLSIYDFELIIDACNDEKLMSLAKLFSFRKKAAEYGFEEKIVTHEIMFRITSLLVILIASIYALTFAWRFRLPPHTSCRFYSIMAIPPLLYAVWFTIEIILYLSRLLIVLLTNYYDFYLSSFILMLCYVVIFSGVCFLFFAQRSDR